MAPGTPSASKAAGELGELERFRRCLGYQPLRNIMAQDGHGDVVHW